MQTRNLDRSTHRPGLRLPAQILDLFLIELTNWRWTWRSMLVTGTLAPLLSILALGVFGRDLGPNTMAYILTGNLVVSLLFGNMNNVQGHIVFMRFMGAMDYFATLPIRRYALILAIVLSFLLLSLPSLVVTLLIGALYLQIPLHVSPALLVVLPVAAISVSGIGAWIGTRARNPHEADSIGLILTLVLSGLGPVIIPPERLPQILIFLGRFNPATYAASALRQALIGPLTGDILVDLGVLATFSAVIFWWVGRGMDWRQE